MKPLSSSLSSALGSIVWSVQVAIALLNVIPLTSCLTESHQCEMLLESCCMAHHRTRNCNSGKQYAKLGAACMDVELSKEATVATESFNDCCMSCSLGILAAKNPAANETKPAHRCKLISPLASSLSGQLYEQTYTECCQENLPRLSSALLDPSAPIDCSQANPCSQRCVTRTSRLRGAEHRCDCFAGYRLAADGATCSDIDECQTDQHTCDRQSEVCDNMRGSFRCLARARASGPSAALLGEPSDQQPVAVAEEAPLPEELQAYAFASERLCAGELSWNARDRRCEPPARSSADAQARDRGPRAGSASSSSFSFSASASSAAAASSSSATGNFRQAARPWNQ